MLLRWAVTGLICAGPVLAQSDDMPARFDVAGTAVSLHASPSATAEVLIELSANRSGVEIVAVSPDGLWGQTTYGDGSAWIRLSKLRRQPAPEDQALPIRCYGVEPFWGLHLPAPFFAEFEQPEHPEIPFQVTGTADKIGPSGRTRLWTFAGASATANLLMRHELCGDTMSDRTYGLSAAFTLVEKTGAVHLHLGCCALTAP